MRSFSVVAVSALLLAFCQIGAAESLFKSEEVSTVTQQRGRTLLQTVPLYGCPNAEYPSERVVVVKILVTALKKTLTTKASAASFGFGKTALGKALNTAYAKVGRTFPYSLIVSPNNTPQGRSLVNKFYTYTFTLDLGKCGTEKRVLDALLRKSIKTIQDPRIRKVALVSYK